MNYYTRIDAASLFVLVAAAGLRRQTKEGEAGFERDTILPKIRHDFHNLIFGKLSTHMPLLIMKLHNSAVVGLSGPARVNINLKPLGGFRNDEITGKSISIGNNDRDRAL